MLKHSLVIQLVVFVAVVSAVTTWVSFFYFSAGPYLHGQFPSIRTMQAERPYIINGLLSLTSLILSFLALIQFSAGRHGLRHGLVTFKALNDVISHANYNQDAGVLFLDAECRVLSASHLVVRLAGVPRVDYLLGKRCTDVYSKKFASLLEDIKAKTKGSRKQVAFEIVDWAQYGESDVVSGPLMLVATPAFKGTRFTGLMLVLRSSTEIHLAEESAILHQKRYQVLFDTLPVGAALVRPTENSDNTSSQVIEANMAFNRAFDCDAVVYNESPYAEPASAVWPSFFAQDKLREGISRVMTGESGYYCDIFFPVLGKYFDVWLAAMPDSLILCLVIDKTEAYNQEQQVLALNDKLRRTLAKQKESMATVLTDINQFNQATVDVVESKIETLAKDIALVPAPIPGKIFKSLAALSHILGQITRYHSSASLPYDSNELVQPGELVSRIQHDLRQRNPHVTFSVGQLPAVVANKEILTAVLEQLMVSLARLPVAAEAPRIEVGWRSLFLTIGICVDGYGLDPSSLVIETPKTMEPLDWTMTSDLDIAAVRRMVWEHGGNLFIGPTETDDGVRLLFTIGSPGQ